ncbi:hypothetical protein K439DRAFT_1559688 [Ramaria rubella]|nr:hypothetical protein K439DRAFT_1559688 [Ramaria rubella]
MPGQLFSGTLGLLHLSSAVSKEKQEAECCEHEGDRGEDLRHAPAERPKIVWFKPTDQCVPLIAIPTEQAPPDFVQNGDTYNNKLFVACINQEELGPIGDVEVETSALLKDCNFPTEDFADNVLKCLPPDASMHAERIFSIDPDTVKDIDDALSIKRNENGMYDFPACQSLGPFVNLES